MYRPAARSPSRRDRVSAFNGKRKLEARLGLLAVRLGGPPQPEPDGRAGGPGRGPVPTHRRDFAHLRPSPGIGEDRDSVAVSEALGGAVVGTLPTSAFTRLHKRAGLPDRIKSRRQALGVHRHNSADAGADRRERIWAKARASNGRGADKSGRVLSGRAAVGTADECSTAHRESPARASTRKEKCDPADADAPVRRKASARKEALSM
jgi:hypothetical protein